MNPLIEPLSRDGTTRSRQGAVAGSDDNPPLVAVNTSLAAALEAAARGYRVFPCRGKVPFFGKGTHSVWAPAEPRDDHGDPPSAGLTRATTDADLIHRHWPTGPSVTVGAVAPERVVVYDVDVPKDDRPIGERKQVARQRYDELRDAYGIPAWVETPSGGYHGHAVRWPDDVPLPSMTRFPIGDPEPWGELRGNGTSYVVVPGGPASRYRFLMDELPDLASIPTATPELVAFTVPRMFTANDYATAREEGTVRRLLTAGDHTAWARAALKGEAAKVSGAMKGGRRSALNEAAFCLGQIVAGGHLTEEEVKAELRTAVAKQKPPMEQARAERTIADGIRDGSRSPRHPTDRRPQVRDAPANIEVLGRKPGDAGHTHADEPPKARDGGASERNTKLWPRPRPLPPRDPDPPRLDPELLPEPLRAYLTDAAELASLRLDYYVPAALVALSTLVGNRFRVQPKRHDDFHVVPNLWGCLIAPSGSMKTSASGVALAPLEDLQRELQAQEDAERKSSAGRIEALEVLADGLRERRRTAARSKGGIDLDSLDSLTAELAAAERAIADLHVKRTVLRVNDPTVERLVELLRDNSRGIAVLRDELIGWLRNLGKQGRESDRAFYLEGWTGDQGHEQERIGRGDTLASIVTLAVYGTIQPGALAPYQRGAIENGEQADGLLQRFQVLVYPGPLGTFENVDRPPNYAARAAVHRLFRALYQLNPADYAEDPPAGFVGFGSTSPGRDYGVLRFDDAAQRVYDEWRAALENRLRFPTETLSRASAYLSHISKYRSLVPSLAGLFHLVNLVSGPATAELNRQNRQNPGDLLIPVDTLCTACAVADYLEAHARRAYSDELDARRNTAAALLDHIAQGHVRDGMTIRDIIRKGWGGLDRDGLTAALQDLEAHGWARLETVPAGPNGGRPSDVVRLHPELFDHLGDA